MIRTCTNCEFLEKNIGFGAFCKKEDKKIPHSYPDHYVYTPKWCPFYNVDSECKVKECRCI